MSSSEEEYASFSLGRAVEARFGAPSPHLGASQSWVARGLYNWCRISYLSTRYHSDGRNEVDVCFSGRQSKSFKLLWEWWTAQYHHPSLSAHQTTELLTQYPGGPGRLTQDLCQQAYSTSTIDFDWDILHKHLQVRGDAGSPSATTPHIENYHRLALQLFHTEFFRDCNYGNFDDYHIFLTDLAGERYNLCEAAYVQSTALGAYLSLLQQREFDGSSEQQKSTWPYFVNPWTDMPWYPYAAWQPVFEPCPWLAETPKDLSNLPYYLWDVHTQRTVRVRDLEEVPDYTAVSHTWGRWISDPPITVDLAGVDWPIPCNSIFDVEALPDLLDQLPTLTPYVWFDLVCIPQNGGEIMEQEIAKQAQIFRHATHAVTWMNEISDLQPMQNLAKWLCLNLLRFAEGTTAERSRLRFEKECWADLEHDSTGLMMHKRSEETKNPRHDYGRAALETWWDANYWSTSLWTLQEVCLRPDMWVLDREFKFLSIEEGVSMYISGLISIWESFSHFLPAGGLPEFIVNLGGKETYTHPALIELQMWAYVTGLDNLTEMSRMDILALGDRRYCKERRADAIMSAIGVTRWKENTDAAIMVLERYPLSFVREVCALNPAQFFGSYIKFAPNSLEIHEGSIEDARFNQVDPKWDEKPIEYAHLREGTMLPFTKDGSRCTNVGTTGFHTDPHHSIFSWKILSSGAVEILEACILSSPEIAACWTASQTGSTLPTAIYGVSIENARSVAPHDESEKAWNVDLHDFVHNRKWHAYAIVVQHRSSIKVDGPAMVTGIILRQESLQPEEHQKSEHLEFTKVGLFNTLIQNSVSPLPKTTAVNWLVL
ncbi:hypothetical protein H2200_011720 [Cladophialophora chaetospira]|uniref:Heterokaryon incompatibility domain-containing protein n=1 Tax=Cladophialophora chaetospira TaxID=386627 RepID=A0AA38WYL6_9EURO|nr:hypothetical protein H2200_011720 [Cladophialophora chaetospira]